MRLAGNLDTPSGIVATREQANFVRTRFTTDELAVVDRRIDGESCEQIAEQLGGIAEALRKKVTRANTLVVKQVKV